MRATTMRFLFVRPCHARPRTRGIKSSKKAKSYLKRKSGQAWKRNLINYVMERPSMDEKKTFCKIFSFLHPTYVIATLNFFLTTCQLKVGFFF